MFDRLMVWVCTMFWAKPSLIQITIPEMIVDDPLIYSGKLTPAHILKCAKLIDVEVIDNLSLRERRKISMDACMYSLEEVFDVLSYININMTRTIRSGRDPLIIPDDLPRPNWQTIDLDIMLTNGQGRSIVLSKGIKAWIGMLEKLNANWQATTDEVYIEYYHRRLDHVLKSLFTLIKALVMGSRNE